MLFKDRMEAANLLLKELEKYKGQHPLVLGIPRGAMPMAQIIAKGLEGELGAILVHKIGAPYHEEYAIGSIGLSGKIQLSSEGTHLDIPEDYIKSEAKKQLAVLKEREKQYGLKKFDFKNRIVIIVDDGIATGETTLAAIHEVRHYHPQKTIIAAPVASLESVRKIKKFADEVVILHTPLEFYAVGQFYKDFAQVTDEEVLKIFKENSPF